VLDESLRLEIARLQSSGANAESETAGEDRPPENESHVKRLLNLLKKLESINDRGNEANSGDSGSSNDFDLLVIAALREAECADLIEKSMEADLTGLCSELKRKDEALQAREMTLVKLQETSKAQLAELQTRILNQQNRINHLEAEQQEFSAERNHLADSLAEAELAAKQAEADARQFKERMEKEFSALKLQIAKREQSVDATKSDPPRAEGDNRDIETLQHRLQDTEAKLASQERELKEKERTIHAAGLRETELGKLIERLSAECEKLSSELCEKQLLISRFGDKTRYFADSGKSWKKTLIRLLRAGRSSSANSNHT
jgi:chromosome segregation ATPase